MPSDFHPVEFRFFWTRGVGPVSRIISRVTAPLPLLLARRTDEVPSHMGIILSDADGVCVYGEAHYDTGWRYPRPIAALLAERDSHPDRKLWIGEPLPIAPENLALVHSRAIRNKLYWHYSKYQIWRLWLWRRFGLRVKSPLDGIVCSEAASKSAWPWYDLPAILDVPDHDYVEPANSFFGLGPYPECKGDFP